MAESEQTPFSSLLRQYRRAASLSQEALAARAGLSTKGIAQLETGHRRAPRPETVALLAAALDLTRAERTALIAAAAQVHINRTQPLSHTGFTSLHLPLTSLIGREHEIAAVSCLLEQPEVRLLTLTGPGGVGKTRLALQVAATCRTTFADGVILVELAPLRDPALVLPTIAQSLGLRDAGERLVRDRLIAHLRDKDLLLLLDNCEQVADAAPHVSEVLEACPHLRVLATSRAPLHMRGEQEFTVPPLTLPEPAQIPNLEVLAQVAAVALFVQRARAVRHGFALTTTNAFVVAALCHRLDGLPLALELAAARLKLLPPETLLARLDHQLELPKSETRDLPERQRTLRATLDWSYDLLDTAGQILFRRLAVFAGGCSLEAAEVVGAGGVSSEASGDVLGRLSALVDQSLLHLDESVEGGEPRLGMLETIRAYGLERLAASGEEGHIRSHHAAWYLELVETVEPALLGPEQVTWLARLERERDNLRAALHWACEQGETEIGLRIAGALWRFWHLHGYVSEGQGWLDTLLAQSNTNGGQVEVGIRAKALRSAGGLAYDQGDYARAWAWYEEAWHLYEELGDKENLAGARHNLGIVAHAQGNDELAVALYKESLALARCLEHGDSIIAAALDDLGNLARQRGDATQARAFLEECLALRRALGDTFGIANVLGDLAAVLYAEGDAEQALTLYHESVALCEARGYVQPMAQGLEGIAGIAMAQGQAARAARLAGAAAALRQRSGMSLEPEEGATYDQKVAAVRAALGVGAFAAAWAEGEALKLEQALAEAQDTCYTQWPI